MLGSGRAGRPPVGACREPFGVDATVERPAARAFGGIAVSATRNVLRAARPRRHACVRPRTARPGPPHPMTASNRNGERRLVRPARPNCDTCSTTPNASHWLEHSPASMADGNERQVARSTRSATSGRSGTNEPAGDVASGAPRAGSRSPGRDPGPPSRSSVSCLGARAA